MTLTISDEEIEKVVRRLKERDGVCSPRAFVEEARDVRSLIHGLFEWDDESEAAKWRIYRARQIIGRVHIIENEVRTPAFVHVTIVTGQSRREGYVPTEEAVADPDMRAQVFREVRAGLRGWRNRLVSFEKFEQAHAAVAFINQAIESLDDQGGGL